MIFDGGILKDVRYALRSFARRRVFVATAIATLGIGIGTAGVAYSLTSQLLLNQLAYRDAHRIVFVFLESDYAGHVIQFAPTPCLVADWTDRARDVEAFGQYATRSWELRDDGPARHANVAIVDPGYLRFAGITPLLGRQFADHDGDASHGRVAIISERLWRERYGKSPGVLGRHLQLDDASYSVIGVVGRDAALPVVSQVETDVWIAGDLRAQSTTTLARLAPVATVTGAAAELRHVAANSKCSEIPPDARVRLERPSDALGSLGRGIAALSIGAAILLALALCSVVALVMTQTWNRRHEWAIKSALGLGRGRALRQTLVEALLLVAPAGLLGLALNAAFLMILDRVRPATMAGLGRARIDAEVVGAAVAVTAMIVLAIGIGAWLRSADRGDGKLAATPLKSSGLSRQATIMQAALVGVELGLSTLLLVAAIFLARNFVRLNQVDPGFAAQDLFAVRVRLPGEDSTSQSREQAIKAIVDRLETITGVQSVGTASGLPPIRTSLGFPLEVEEPNGSRVYNRGIFVAGLSVGRRFFATARISFHEGGPFGADAVARGDVILDEALAQHLWPGTSAVGKRLRYIVGSKPTQEPWHTVVGVTNNLMTRSLTSIGDDGVIFTPAVTPAYVVFRARASQSVFSLVDDAVRGVTGSTSRVAVESASKRLGDTIALPRFMMEIIGWLAVVATLISMVGLYGLLHTVVASRTRDIGIRIALGSSPSRVMKDVLRPCAIAAAAGYLCGLVATIWAGDLIHSLAFDIPKWDLTSYLVATGVIFLSCVVAAVRPAHRAANVDPVQAMGVAE